MKNLLFSSLLMMAMLPRTRAQVTSFQVEKPFLKLWTSHVGISAGASRLGQDSEHGTGYSFQYKKEYMATGVLYVNAGVGYTIMQDWVSTPDASGAVRRAARSHGAITVPIGGGYAMGDDRGTFFTGIDFLPAYYPGSSTGERSLVLGFVPEVGFMLKVGAARTRGVLLGMMGRWECLPYLRRQDPYRIQYSFGGVGLVMRF